MKDLLYEMYLQAGAPTLDEIAESIVTDESLAGAPGRDTVRRCVSTPEPGSQADVVAITAVLATRAALDSGDAIRRVRELWVAVLLEQPLGRLVADYAADERAVIQGLQVHPAVDAGDSEVPGLLTTYVRRDLDTRLSRLVEDAVTGTSDIAVLIGESSSGKTRAVWEAIRELPSPWRLWNPAETSHDALAETISRLPPRTVVWLDEAHHLFLDPVHGAAIAGALRKALNDPDRRPILALGTTWPEYWAQLVREPSEFDTPAHLRHLLSGKGIGVPSRFEAGELAAVSAAGTTDPRLTEAWERAEEGQITQYLAASPALQQRYETAPVAARALVDAAIDAVRLGHGEQLPAAVLEAAVPGYLTRRQWDDLPDLWERDAWAFAQHSVRGARGLLYRQRPHPGGPSSDVLARRLTDYIEQHGRRVRGTVAPPPELWTSLVGHAEATTALARAARCRGLLETAYRLYHRAGDARSLRQAADLLRESGRTREAIDAYLDEPLMDDPCAVGEAALLLVEAGRLDEALSCFAKAAAADGEDIADDLEARRDEKSGDEDLLAWLRSRAAAGNADAAAGVVRANTRRDTLKQHTWLFSNPRLMSASSGGPAKLAADVVIWRGIQAALKVYADLALPVGGEAPIAAAGALVRSGRVLEGMSWYERAALDGHPFVFAIAAHTLGDSGADETATRWLSEHAAAGRAHAVRVLARSADADGRTEEAVRWYRQAAGQGDLTDLRALAAALAAAGETAEALAIYESAQRDDVTHPGDQFEIGRLLVARGRPEEAIEKFRGAVGAGCTEAVGEAARTMAAQGRVDDGVHWMLELARKGGSDTVLAVARIVSTATDVIRTSDVYRDAVIALFEGAAARAVQENQWHGSAYSQLAAATEIVIAPALIDQMQQRSAVDAEDAQALFRLEAARILHSAGCDEQAMALFERAADSGEPDAIIALAEVLEEAGDTRRALTWFDRGMLAGSHEALDGAVRLRHQRDGIGATLTWLWATAQGGHPVAFGAAVRLLETGGRQQEARRLARNGWTVEGSIADDWYP
ncbi:hypothetical protein [Actinoplanes italicus]|uniref:TPR repeat protein n=1 Tax=Actinoplanes italicus TaxID=113567 RepID=A0A2T0KHF1_9ACTN|nr:hypothetical protein [Actinoplanes italicus]PRX22848.1 hypothetical protein CLV67_104376 [Actinoplanes italicus]